MGSRCAAYLRFGQCLLKMSSQALANAWDDIFNLRLRSEIVLNLFQDPTRQVNFMPATLHVGCRNKFGMTE
jgi:hypothetical protein